MHRQRCQCLAFAGMAYKIGHGVDICHAAGKFQINAYLVPRNGDQRLVLAMREVEAPCAIGQFRFSEHVVIECKAGAGLMGVCRQQQAKRKAAAAIKALGPGVMKAQGLGIFIRAQNGNEAVPSSIGKIDLPDVRVALLTRWRQEHHDDPVEVGASWNFFSAQYYS